MRRRDREITDRGEITAILSEATVCRIGLADGGEPYVVPLCFGYEDGSVYIHSAPEGKKIDILAKNPRVCVEADICDGVIREGKPCSWGMRYRSVIGFGRAVILSDPEEKRHGLDCILRHYGGRARGMPDIDPGPVAVIRIDLDRITGKKA